MEQRKRGSCDFPAEARQELKWKINVSDVWMLFRKDVTHIAKPVTREKSGIYKCGPPMIKKEDR